MQAAIAGCTNGAREGEWGQLLFSLCCNQEDMTCALACSRVGFYGTAADRRYWCCRVYRYGWCYDTMYTTLLFFFCFDATVCILTCCVLEFYSWQQLGYRLLTSCRCC